MENSSDLPSPNSIKDSCTPAINLLKGINPCVLLDKHGRVVAKGYTYNLEGDMLHGKELPQHHLRVSINFPIDENAPLPIENEMDNLFTMEDVVKAFVAWPSNLISNDNSLMLTRDWQAKKGETSGHTKESIASPEKKKGTKEAIVSPEKKNGTKEAIVSPEKA
ncbi:hypothetical protein RIF29_10012 [Crotalaria pallida]|uniref:DUF8039 domain-containing protein n=1 Tax=Crotalaria pallida TaxID=3830 RepID=A0AAN9FSG8_CROPI